MREQSTRPHTGLERSLSGRALLNYTQRKVSPEIILQCKVDKSLIRHLAQKSFLESLGGDRHDSMVYTFVGETANTVPVCLGTFGAIDEQYFVNNRLQNDSDFYENLDSLLFPDPSASFENTIPSDYCI
jgi:hypothetical protein